MLVNKKIKVIILIGGSSKGTRFRPLSLDLPKTFFPIAGMPMVHHHLEQITKKLGDSIIEVLFLGFHEPQTLSAFVKRTSQRFNAIVRYLKEPESLGLGTAGGLSYFKEEILKGSPELILLLHGDICCSFPVDELINAHLGKSDADMTIVGTKVLAEEANRYGCIVADENTNEVIHYAEKPETYISNLINCGIYCLKPSLISNFKMIKSQKKVNTQILDLGESNPDKIRLENDILAVLAGTTKLYVMKLKEGDFWHQIKTAGGAIQSNELYMEFYKEQHPERLTSSKQIGCEIVGHVVVDEFAEIDPTAKIGPNVSIGAGVKIGKGVRISNSVILEGVEIMDNSFINYAIIGWNSTIGRWTRVEGSPDYSRTDDDDKEEKITIFGAGVKAASGIVIRNCVVLPHKELETSVSNKILL